jgi:1-aminocyclopropane-1-carboxylate deaminase/D-cysteine desulfhydrase-like pyridoxal-dependent ACC family enzyme
LIDSPIQKVAFRGYQLHVKRDDLLDYDLSGNKARKLYYYIKNNQNIKKIISYGGIQSNLMYSLSALAKKIGAEYIYYAKPIPSYLKDNLSSNLLGAINNGMKLIEIEHDIWNNKIEDIVSKDYDNDTVLVRQGGLQKEAEYGLEILAQELKDYISQNNLGDISIFLPSGTGATALYLQKHIKNRVYTTACVGDSDYLLEQMIECDNNISNYPTIIKTKQKFHFGKLYKEHIELYKELIDTTDIEFDLLYDPVGFRALIDNSNILPKDIIYIHCGGIIGNTSMIDRYNHKYKVNF